MKHFLYFVTLLLTTSTVFANSVQKLETSPVPDWVKVRDLGNDYDVPKEQLSDGIYYLLAEVQTKVERNDSVSRYIRNARLITNPKGVETSSQLDFSYDPSYQSIHIHSVHVLRDGKLINKLSDARISILQQEEELEQLIYNGNETINLVLNDIRVGDTLDYSFSINGQNPVYDGIFSQTNYFQWSVPLLNRSVRILWQKKKPLRIKQHNQNLEIKQNSYDGGIEYTVEQSTIKPLYTNSNTPQWFNKYAFIEFSETESWRDVISWSINLFENAASSDSTIREVAQGIKDSTSDKKQQLSLALEYVQQEIRYLGIEIGENSHRPSLARETLARRYGDCKDKTVLLIALLSELGIESYPALVNTELNKELANRLPKPGAFDHVIVKAIIGEASYWLDPTRQYQNRSLDSIFQPDYGRALVISKENESLETPEINFESTFIKTEEEFNLTDDYNQPIEFSSTSLMSGFDAENARSQLASNGLMKTRANYLNYYQKYYPDIVSKQELTFEEQENGQLKSIEQYVIEDFWHKDEEAQEHNAWFYANIISQYLSRNGLQGRVDPLAISFPVNASQTIVVNFAEKDWNFSNGELIETNKFFDFSRVVKYNPDSSQLTLQFKYKSKVNYVSAEELPLYDKALEKLEDVTTYGIYRRMASSSEGNSNSMPESADLFSTENLIYFILGLEIILLIAGILLWRIEEKFHPYQGDVVYYPVAIPKFLVMSLLTYGIYNSYWIYKNFKYLKVQSGRNIMPIARGIFDYIWFFPLYSNLRDESLKNEFKAKLPSEWIIGLLAAFYFILNWSKHSSDFILLNIILSAVVLLPLVHYVNQCNQGDKQAIKYNSKWSTRHAFLGLASVPLLVITMGATIRILPTEMVIPGDELMRHDLQFLQRKGVISPSDEVDYFYSDAFLFIRNDGSGFTERHVFSYWINEQGNFQFESAEYAEIKDIEVTWSKSQLDNTIVKIILADESYFLLFASSSDKKDKIFVKQLRKYWNKHR